VLAAAVLLALAGITRVETAKQLSHKVYFEQIS
jgi:hypothetical protein